MATYASIKYDFTPPTATISAQVGGGAMVLIKSIDSDGSDATMDFVDGASGVVLDSTYKTYIFKFMSIHPETDNTQFTFNGSIDSGSNYNVTKTTTFWRASHEENDSAAAISYQTDKDIAQGTGYQQLAQSLSADNDGNVSGELWLFNPSDTTFIKHFIATMSETHGGDIAMNNYVAGYFNTASAIDAIQFKMASDEIQAGTINMYGIA